MHFPAFFSWTRRLGRRLLYELYQAVLGVALGRRLGSLRSALGRGGAGDARYGQGPAVRPRRPKAGPSPPHFTRPATA